MSTLPEIINLMKERDPEGVLLVTKAYNFAEKAHKDQKRFSGDPYFVHLSETAKILAGLGMGAKTISAGLLHDSIEDANVSPELVEKEFGKEIRFLVEGVTKLGKLRYHGAERYVESLRKLFVAMAQDLRVLIIKLADRLHNMRTLQYVRKDKQHRIALETLEIYAPLAYRLGIRKLNRELEDLAFSYVYPDEFKKVQELLKSKGHETREHLEKLRKSIMKGLAKSGITNIQTDYRVKSIYSLYQKLLRKYWDIDSVYDIMAVRVIVPTVEDCYKVLGVVHKIWRPLPGRIKDYIAFPKPNGYRSLHTTIFTGDGSIMEIQIRTKDMQKESEYGIVSHIGYKEKFDLHDIKNAGINWIKQFLPLFSIGEKLEKENLPAAISGDVPTWLGQLAKIESDHGQHDDFIKEIKADFFKTRVFVFTPKGDVVDLPTEASPVDFAYAIHSDVGDHMTGARVNGKMVAIDTILKNGDIVEILVKENARPSHRMLDSAKTSLAKKHIRNAMGKQL
jgi:GTP pyrophosphokinase